jgi:eukaryotic-like serine/threonine-protein kinase
VDGDVFGIVGSTQAGFFRIDRVVAEGGFGVVYQAFHTAFRAPVALKCLKVPETMTPKDRDLFLERFREEGEMLFRLSSASPAVVRPLHVDAITMEGGRFVPFLALEWLEGEPFDVIIRRRNKQGKAPLGIRSLVPFLQPIAHALAQAHSLATTDGKMVIIHRDIKPDNIFVVRAHGRESVRILDFGIARAKSAASLHAGQSTLGDGVDAFTPRYAAPEQWLPKRFGQTGPWTDVWGLALTMVEALTGEPPIGGNDDVATMMGIALDPAFRPTPRLLGAEVPDGVEQAFHHALAVDPRERTQSIEVFWTDLETALEMPLSFRAASRQALSSAASIPPPPVSRSLAETQLAAAEAVAAGQSLAIEAIRFTPNEQQIKPLAPVRIEVTTNERISPAPRVNITPNERISPIPGINTTPTDRISPSPRVNITPNERISPAPRVNTTPNERISPSPRALNSLSMDVDVNAMSSARTAPVEKVPTKSFRHQVEPLPPPPSESDHSLDWADIWTKLRWPVQIMLLSLIIVAAELYYPRMTSSTLESFGVRPMWAAAVVATVALSWACVRLFFGR